MKEVLDANNCAKTRKHSSGGSMLAIALLLIFLLGGCQLGPPVLKDSVLGYDETAADLELKLLLLNNARRDAGAHSYHHCITYCGNFRLDHKWQRRGRYRKG